MWNILTDFAAYPAWNPFIPSLTGSAAVGTRLDARPRSRRAAWGCRLQPTVLAAAPNEELRWLGHLFVPGLFDGEHHFQIEPRWGQTASASFRRSASAGLLCCSCSRFIEGGPPGRGSRR